MTRPLPFTKARLRRAIEAAREAGLRVTGIRPDGTLIVDDNPQAPEKPVEEKRQVVARVNGYGADTTAARWTVLGLCCH
jgi:hypothetical protein